MFLLGQIEAVSRILVPMDEFTVPVVLADIVILDRTESAKSDIQRNIEDLHSFLF